MSKHRTSFIVKSRKFCHTTDKNVSAANVFKYACCKFSDAEGDVLSVGSGSASVKRVSDNSVVSGTTSFSGSSNSLIINMSVSCGESYYLELPSGLISDGNGGSTQAANASSNPKLFHYR